MDDNIPVCYKTHELLPYRPACCIMRTQRTVLARSMERRPQVTQDVRHDAALVLGGGIAGMRAAIDLADAGVRVHLIERSPTLGGKVDHLDTTFPTQNCTLCRSTLSHGVGCPRPTIAPYFLEHLERPEIKIHTLTELVSLEGEAGAFVARVRHQPRYVDVERCTTCGDCRAVCPVELPDEYNIGLCRRRAIDRPSPQAVPRAYALTRVPACSSCRRCVEICPTQAIDLDQQASEEALQIGAVIVATGYRFHDARQEAELGYGRYPNVLTGPELERLLSGPGPTGGRLRRPSDGRVPQRVAFLQCVGSRDQSHAYCSSVCCMYALKEAILIKEQAPEAQCELFLMDMRTFNKGQLATLERARDDCGVALTHCRLSSLKEDPATHDVLVRYTCEDGRLHEKPFDLVVLSTGLEPSAGTAELMATLGTTANEHGFCTVQPLAQWRTTRPGVFACGAAVEPQDIPESVTQASAAAAEVAQWLAPRAPQSTPAADLPPERDVSKEEPRIGVFVCHCGAEIDAVLDVPALLKMASGLEGVTYATDLPYACLSAGREAIARAVTERGLNRVVVAACTPRAYEGFFRAAARQGGINPYLLEMVNIREQGAWAHPSDPAAQAQAAAALSAGVARARWLRPLQAAPRSIAPNALVLGGGAAGLTAALALAERGIGVTVVEREAELGGGARLMDLTPAGDDVRPLVQQLVSQATRHPSIEVLCRSTLAGVSGEAGSFTVRIASHEGEIQERTAGAIILATGGQEYRGHEYLLGQDRRVLTQSDLERILADDPSSLAARSVVMIQCVAPDERCSRVCCAQAIANARRLRALDPQRQVFVLYQDIRTYGFDEALYTAARREGIIFARYERGKPPQVSAEGGALRVTLPDLVLGGEMALQPDLLILSTALLPAPGTAEVAAMLGIPTTPEGYFAEAHPKLRPVECLAEGIFMCGLAHYPKFLDESIAQAQAAAGKAAAFLAQGIRWGAPAVAVVTADKCVGCLTCVRLCPYKVPHINGQTAGNGGILGAAEIDPSRCQGCGLCASECPAKAIQLEHYRDVQVQAAVQAALAV